MASKTDVKAGSAFVRVWLNDEAAKKGLQKLSTHLKRSAQQMSSAGRGMMMGSAMALAPLVASVKQFADFETTMANVSTMVDDVDAHMANFRDGIRKMSVELGESTDTLGKGLYDILSASIAPAKALDVLAVSARAAAGGMTDTAVSADAITTVLNAYALSADRAGDVSDWLFAIVKRGKTTYAELAPAIGKVVTFANTAGISLEELGAMLATLTRVGLDTDESVTAVANTLKAFLIPGDEAVAMADALGMEMNIATLQAEGLHGVFKRISSLPPEMIAKLFPNIRGLRGVLPALQNLEGFGTDLEVMANRAGMADAAFEKMAGTLGHKMKQAWQTIKDLAVTIGEQLAPDVESLSGWIRENGAAVTGWIRSLGSVISIIGKLLLATGGLGIAMVALAVPLSAAASGLRILAAVAPLVVQSLTLIIAHPVVAAFVAIVAAVGTLVAAFKWADAQLEETSAKWVEKLERMRAATAKGQSEEMGMMSRLGQLAAKNELNNAEMDEASKLIDTLSERYGNLGVWMDRASKQVHGFAGAHEELRQKMASIRGLQISAEIQELEQQFRQAEKGTHVSALAIVGLGKGSFLESGIEESRAKMQELSTKIAALKSEEAMLGKAGVTPPAAPKSAGAPKVIPPEVLAQQRLAAAKREATQEMNLLHEQQQLRISLIADEHQRELWSIHERYRYEIEQAKAAGEATTGIEQTREMALQAARIKHQRDLAEEKARQAQEVADTERGLRVEMLQGLIETKVPAGTRREELLKELGIQERMRSLTKAGVDPKLIAEWAKLERERTKATESTAKYTTAGTFDPFAAARMGGGPMDKVAKNTDTTAKNTKEIITELRRRKGLVAT